MKPLLHAVQCEWQKLLKRQNMMYLVWSCWGPCASSDSNRCWSRLFKNILTAVHRPLWWFCSPQMIPESYWSYPSLQKKSEQINPQRAAKLHTITEEVAWLFCSKGKNGLFSWQGQEADAHLHIWTKLTSPKAALIQEPGICNAEMSIPTFNFTDQKTETQKGKINYPRSVVPMVLSFIKLELVHANSSSSWLWSFSVLLCAAHL